MTERPTDYDGPFHSGTGSTQPHSDDTFLHVGDRLFQGRYKVLEIRHGGMGYVYKCEDLVTRLMVALKTVQAVGGMTEDDVKEMVRSFRLIYGLSHPHIIRVNYLDKEVESENWFVSMEWVEGEDLETRLKKTEEGVLSKDETVRILEQVAAALDYAHGKGVVHRDVKCANIMLKPDGDVLLIDFGIAGHAAASATNVRTSPYGLSTTVNPFTGTAGYQPPEQWRGNKTSAASDQYSLAVTAYRCLSGHLPFEHPNRGELREMVMYDDPPRIRAISADANAVLKKALAKKTEERYGSCMEFIRELARGLAVANTPQQPSVAIATPPSPSVSHKETLPEGDVTLNLNGVNLTLKRVAAGTFMMGSNDGDEKPVHKVMLTKDFWLGETEITQSQYEAVMGENPSVFKKGGNYPVECVSWVDAMEFCKKLTERERRAGRLKEGYEYSLPTEAQWEYAARGGGKSKGYEYSGGDNLDDVGWYYDNFND
ncbi:MAG: protein kinase, partial [Victivallales bacterium]|nr:protein kinase [Victivallales bacterium]